MVVVNVLKTLWSILDRRGKAYFSFLVSLLMISGVAEMGGMMAILGFIRGLKVAETGHRSGPIGHLVQRVVGGIASQEDYVLVGGSAVLGFIILKNLQSMAVQFAMNRFLMKRNLLLAEELFAGYLSAPYERLQPQQVGGSQRRITEIFGVFSKNFSGAAQVLADGLMIGMVSLLLLFHNPALTIMSVLVFGVVGSGIYWSLQRTLISMGRDEHRAKTDANRYLKHAFKGIVETRLRDLRRYFIRGYITATSRTTMIERRRLILKRIPKSTNEILLTSMIVGSVFYLTISDQTIESALPTLALFGFAGLRMTGFISRMNSSLQSLRQSDERMKHLTRVLWSVTESFQKDAVVGIGSYLAHERALPKGADGRLHHQVQAENLRFRFPGMSHDIIDGVDLTIPRGSLIAFCGPSGGGKSTLVKLIMGLLVPTEGTVKCDGWNIHHHIRAWHKRIGYVGQDVFLTDGTVKQNIAFGASVNHIDDERVVRALKLASAYEFVQKLPLGIETNLKGGDILSGGQQQRIVIARAMYEEPDLLIFDEATAALDNETEREITSAISRLSREKTVICVAHRLSTIRAADTIHFIRDGRILASGSYGELLESCPAFQSMVQAGELAETEPLS